MSRPIVFLPAPLRYDRALVKAKDWRLPKSQPRPLPTAHWPAENVVLLQAFQDWLFAGGWSTATIQHLYVPTAGYVLGLALRPEAELDLEADFARAEAFVRAKKVGVHWLGLTRNALLVFRNYLRFRRGQLQTTFRPSAQDRHCENLPAWVVDALERYYQVLRVRWRASRLKDRTRSYWYSYTRVWHWICRDNVIGSVADIKRQHLLDFIDDALSLGRATSTINNNLRCFHSILLYLQELGHHVPRALLRPPTLKEPDRLPRFLTETQVSAMRQDLENRLKAPRYPSRKRDAALDLATFYLLWQAGLRVGEVEEVLLEDLDLPGKMLVVRQGKGQKDRVVYLTATVIAALEAYLAVRGPGTDSHAFLYRNKPLTKDIVRSRIKACGRRVGVKATPHQLRHTCATQLLNAGCRITSIQRLLGHRNIDSTLTYARVHDATVVEDYFKAMAVIERGLETDAVESASETEAGRRPSFSFWAGRADTLPGWLRDTLLKPDGG